MNVHNAGCHVAEFVKNLYEWSTYGYEDQNGVLASSVHGTGIVHKQLFRDIAARVYIKTNEEKVIDDKLRDFIARNTICG